MVTIQRRDNSMWALPGGMVDANEKYTATLKREFIEEALNSKEGICSKFPNIISSYFWIFIDFRVDSSWN